MNLTYMQALPVVWIKNVASISVQKRDVTGRDVLVVTVAVVGVGRWASLFAIASGHVRRSQFRKRQDKTRHISRHRRPEPEPGAVTLTLTAPAEMVYAQQAFV